MLDGYFARNIRRNWPIFEEHLLKQLWQKYDHLMAARSLDKSLGEVVVEHIASSKTARARAHWQKGAINAVVRKTAIQKDACQASDETSQSSTSGSDDSDTSSSDEGSGQHSLAHQVLSRAPHAPHARAEATPTHDPQP